MTHTVKLNFHILVALKRADYKFLEELSPLEMKKPVSVQYSIRTRGNHFQAYLIAEAVFNEAIFEFISNIFF